MVDLQASLRSYGGRLPFPRNTCNIHVYSGLGLYR
ncbi:hypothetical protein VP424E501_P0278 [Vibrio phage 424E50-1]|nr:hypothetical protein VP424E501_P0278 [Vibrio phage 424E50-1]